MNKITKNAARCKKCGDVIESRHVHDFVWCQCGAVAVDGGMDYLKRCGNREDMEDLSEYDGRQGFHMSEKPVKPPKTKSAIQHMKLEEE